ncbi:acyltransferase family protein [Paracraurococcus ruber]|uniref:Acyltransferase 3 domain-containing protein n=1 Tax=Paracraurococcus ruber TaxID=77675 RepID=A0ABS1CXH4_9PROT|nr:acyltransferase [Paracraurococcus ruber]MBK1659125.1 hypothetical protein [Paracraurococcus ruber]TDG30262.1 acyltransferase [Paracraurococcus ruber]
MVDQRLTGSGAAGARPAYARLIELDALRGFAAVVVLLHHAVHLMPSVEALQAIGLVWLNEILFEATPLRAIRAGRSAVLFFFVLSGYALTWSLLHGGSATRLPAFAIQRTLRILIPTAVAVGISALLQWAFHDTFGPDDAAVPGNHFYNWLFEPTPLRLLADAALFRNDFNVVLWSLAHEWRLTVLLPLVLVFRRQPLMLLALAAVAMSAGIAAGATEDQVYLPRDPLLGFAATLYFALGIGTGAALALIGPMPILSRQQRWAALLGMVAAFSMASDIASYIGAVLLIALALQPGRLQTVLRRPCAAWLGRMSFSLYLIHVPLLLSAWHILDDVAAGWVIALVGIMVSLLAAPLMHYLVEEPSRKVARRSVAWLASPSHAGGQARA